MIPNDCVCCLGFQHQQCTCLNYASGEPAGTCHSVCWSGRQQRLTCCSWAVPVADDKAVEGAGTSASCTASFNVNVTQQWLPSACRWAAQGALSWSPSGAGGGGAWVWIRKRSSVSLQVGAKGRLPAPPKVHLLSGLDYSVLRLMRQLNCVLDLSAATLMEGYFDLH